MPLHERDEEERTVYKVVVNDEGQHSIWPEHDGNPAGWKDAGKAGLKSECLAYVKEVWTDMRPLSLRKRMEESARNPAASLQTPTLPQGRSLVERLCDGEHPFVLCLRPEPTLERFKEAIGQGYLRINFTDTSPGTELGMRLDRDASDFGGIDSERATGSVRAVSGLTLDYVKLRCVIDVDLETLAGRGRLEKVEAGGGLA
jgi:uncharacterized protein YbdZ (MbtH family)